MSVHGRKRSLPAISKRQIPYFLPQTERRKRYQRRLVRSHLVLFPGYVFALLNDELGARSSQKQSFARSVSRTSAKSQLGDPRDVHRLVQSGQPVTREERLKPGSPARIVRGPLAGLCGCVVSNKKGRKFVLHVQFLQQGVSIAVEGTSIEAL